MLVSPGVRVIEVDLSDTVAPDNSWRGFLRNQFLLHQFDIKGSKDVAAAMQQKYPGPYKVESYWDAEHQRYDYQLIFNDAQEQTLWLLKNN